MKKTAKGFLAFLLCAALLTGCGASVQSGAAAEVGPMDSPMEDGWSEDAMMNGPMEAPEPGTGEERGMQPQASSRKIIHNASLHLESKTYDDTRTQLMQAVAEAGGYVQSSSEEGSAESGNRWAEYTLRIPSDKYSAFLQAAEGSGSLVRKDESTEDVTQQYVDVQARLESLRVQETRLLELAAKAETMEDLLTIEAHLADVHYQIESYTVQQRTYDDQIDYSTITVTLSEVTTYTPVNHSFGSRVSEALGDSWDEFVWGMQDFVIWVIYVFPNLVILAIVVAVVLWVVRRRRASAPERAAKKAAKKAAKAAKKAGDNPQKPVQ